MTCEVGKGDVRRMEGERKGGRERGKGKCLREGEDIGGRREDEKRRA